MKKGLLLLVLFLSYNTFAQSNPKTITRVITQPSAPVTITENSVTNVAIFGQATGAIQITANGGNTGGYTYAWTKTGDGTFSESIDDISGLTVGTYNLTVTDSKGCTATYSQTITQPALLTATVTLVTAIDCFGNSTGTLQANPTGGAGGNSYSWTKNGVAYSAGNPINSLGFGNYVVTVTDANGATTAASYNLTQPTQLNYTLVSKTNILCFGNSTGNININVTGGTGGYTYAWTKSGDVTFNESTQDISGLSSGNYTVIITDANGCSITSPLINISQPSAAISITSPTNGIQNPSSTGASNGSINITVAGGTSGYNYVWTKTGDGTFNETTQDLSGLAQGTYNVLVTDANGCTASTSITLIDPPPFTVLIDLPQAILCNGGTGNLLATATGGIPFPGPSYNYAWYDITSGSQIPLGITTALASNLPAGMYRVIATDNNGITTSADYNLTQPTVLNLSVPSSNNVLCFGGNDGSASVSASGGTPGYTYAWTKTGDGSFSANMANISSLTVGTYNVTVTDANSCSTNTSVTITQPSMLAVQLITQTNVTIAGQSTGGINISVTGGTANYNYEWTKTGDATFNETTQDLTNLSAGIYTVVLTDSSFATSTSNAGCTVTANYTITEPAPLNASLAITQNLLCFGDSNGEITATPSGGVGTYTYQWSEIVAGTATPITGATSAVLSSIDAGEYEISVSDVNGASITNTIVLTQPTQVVASLVNSINVLCFGESTGSIDISVSGGTGSYTYEWFNAGTSLSIFTQDIANLPPGNYTVNIQDTNGCMSTSLGNIVITEPASGLSVNTDTVTDLLGFETGDGSIVVDIIGGTPGYLYAWRVQGVATVIGATNSLSNLQIGNYELTVTDANGCTLVQVYTVNQPPLLEITAINQNNQIQCFGDTTASVEALVTGGVPGYQYSWYNSLDNTTILSTTQTLSGIGIGNYVINITDANGITTSSNITITQPPLLDITTVIPTDVSCFGGNDGEIDIAVAGGTGVYTYQWSNGGSTTNSLTNLIAGTYSVTVFDQNLCSATTSVTITEPVTGLSISNITIGNVSGNGLTDGSIEATVAGGTAPYSYQWTDSSNTILGTTTNLLDNIGADLYDLLITDANGCTLEVLDYVVVEPDAIVITINESPINCFGETGELTANVTGGIMPYVYEWTDASATVISTGLNTGLVVAGTYNFKVTDANGIVTTANNIVLSDPALLEITNISITDNICYGGNAGVIDITVAGGTGNYTYNWSNNGSTTNVLSGQLAGDYTVTVTDENSCFVDSTTITIAEPVLYDITDVNLISPSNLGVPDGSIEINITGGMAPYDYEWIEQANGTVILSEINTNATTSTLSSIIEGTYIITITDAIGCVITDTYNLANPGEILVSITQTSNISCFNGSDGEITVTVSGGSGGNNYVWYDTQGTLDTIDDVAVGTNSNILTNIAAATYYVVVTNAENVTEQSIQITVTEPTAVIASISSTNLSCFEATDGTFTVTAGGGTGPYQYQYQINNGGYGAWTNFTSTTESLLTGLTAENYDVRIRDSLNCFYEVSGSIGVLSTLITQPDLLIVDSFVVNDPTGFGFTDGSIDVTITGGTLPYIYQWSDTSGVLAETTNLLQNIGIGTYTVLVTDANSCTVQQTFTLNQPDELLVTIDDINVLFCNGDATASLQAIPVGGILPYSYEWFEVGNVTPIGTNVLIENLIAGTYYVVLTDANAVSIQSTNFEVTQPEILTGEIVGDYVLCGDGNDWEITTTVSGGTAPYSYLWNTSDTSANLLNVTPGIYTVNILDFNGCELELDIELIPPPALTASATLISPTCFNGADGLIDVNVVGGTSPYSYSWNTSADTNSISNLMEGSYTITITDSRGCEIIETYQVVNPEEIIVDLGDDVTLCMAQTHILDATIADATSYQWTSNNGFTSSDAIVEVSEAGVYTVVSTNILGCQATDEVVIFNSEDIISAEFYVSTQVFTNEAFVAVNASNPIPDGMLWELPNEAEIIEVADNFVELRFATAGTYDITLITGIGECIESQTKTVIVIEPEDLIGGEQSSNAPMITDFSIYPNPTNGVFTVNIELREEQPVSLKTFDLINNTMVDNRTINGESAYQSNYNLNVPSGIYFVILETPYATQLRKIIIE